MRGLLKGRLVNLAAVNPEEMSQSFTAWNRDSEWMRLLDSGPARQFSVRKSKEWIEKHLEKSAGRMYWFTIRSAVDDRPLGDISLEVADWNPREAFVGLGIGPRDFWGRGFGTEAMQLVLEYAFLEVNLQRVTLNVFEYNPRAIRSYEKAGFRHEGRMREALFREGKRWDLLYMGIRRSEWMENYGYPIAE
jgi:RimJ/RimL family protein N-acetyltransferase